MLYVFVYVWNDINQVINIQKSINAADIDRQCTLTNLQHSHALNKLNPLSLSECVSPLSFKSSFVILVIRVDREISSFPSDSFREHLLISYWW